MDAIIVYLLRLLDTQPYQAWLLPISVFLILAYLLQHFVQYVEQGNLTRRNGVLAILANPHCPEKMLPLMIDYLEAQAFQLTTNAFVTKKEQVELMTIYERHIQELNPRDIGRAMEYLRLEAGMLKRGLFYWVSLFALWVCIACLIVIAPILLANLILKGASAPSGSTTLLVAEFLFLGFFAIWEYMQLSITKRVLTITTSAANPDDSLLPVTE